MGLFRIRSRLRVVGRPLLELVVVADEVVVEPVGFDGLSSSLSVKEGTGVDFEVVVGVVLGVVCGDPPSSSSVPSRSPSF